MADDAIAAIESEYASAHFDFDVNVGLIDFKRALKAAKQCLDKSTLPVLSYARLTTNPGRVEMTATNLNVWSMETLPADIRGRGTVLVPIAALDKLLANVKDSRVRIVREPMHKVRVESGGMVSSVISLPPDEYPEMPVKKMQMDFVDLAPSDFSSMLHRVVFATSTDETRYNLCNVYMNADGKGALTMAATDGHRLAQVVHGEGYEGLDGELLVPRRLACAVAAALGRHPKTVFGMRVDGQDGLIDFRIGLRTLSGVQGQGQFPDYKQVIPKLSLATVLVDRAPLLAAVKPLKWRDEKNRPEGVHLEVSHDGMKVTQRDPNMGTASCAVPCVLGGEAFEIAVQPGYLTEALEAFDTKSVVIGVTDHLSPIVIHDSEEPGHKQVVMPMRL